MVNFMFFYFKKNIVIICVIRLMVPTCTVLEVLGSRFPFEITVGMNGRVWIKSKNPRLVVNISRTIQNSRGKNETELRDLIESLIRESHGTDGDENDRMDVDNNNNNSRSKSSESKMMMEDENQEEFH
jgi:exosome complex RNA-binding protein Rrp4